MPPKKLASAKVSLRKVAHGRRVGKKTERSTSKMLASAEECRVSELSKQLADRERAIELLKEELNTRDALIADKSQLIEQLERWYPESFAADVVSLGGMSELTIQYVDPNEEQTTSVGDARQLLEQYEEEHGLRMQLTEQNEQLLSQWDSSLEYVDRVQKQLAAEMKRVSELSDENAYLRKRVQDTVIISKSGVQFIAIFFMIFSLYLYNC